MLVIGEYTRRNPPPLGATINVTHPLARGLGYYIAFNEAGGVPMSLRESTLSKRVPQAELGTGGTWVPGGMRVNSGGENGPRFHGMNWTTNCTMLAHVTIESVTGDYPAILSKRNAGGDTGWQFNKSDTSLGMRMHWSSGALRDLGQIWPGTGEHMFVVTYDASDTTAEWRAYIDGREVGTNATSNYPSFAADSIYVNLGIAYPGYSHYLTGIYHAIGFWVSNALTASEVALLWHNPYCLLDFDAGHSNR